MPDNLSPHAPVHPNEVREDIVERVMARRGKFHLFDGVEPAKTAFVVIDMQNAFMQPGAPVEVPAARGIVPKINEMAAALRDAGGDVVWVWSEIRASRGRADWRHLVDNIVAAEVRDKTIENMAPGADGTKLWHAFDLHADDLYIVKNRFSCLAPGASSLLPTLRSRGIDTLLIGGTKTNICCETTARDAADMDFRAIMVSDCNAALSDREHLAALENVIQQFGDVMLTEDVIARFQPAG